MRTVVVAGGGPSGSIAAKNLAPSNINVYLVEKDVKRIKPCGGGIPSRAFEEFNLPVSATYREVKTISVISPKGLRVDMPLEGGPLLMVEREIFDRNLRDIAEKAGARLIEAEITSVEKRGRSLDITIIEDGKEKNLKADFLIAADGVNSRVVSALSLAHLPCLYTMME
ncbi:MAG TPA: geranylgeranyl diphosphate reductase, partial [Nitrospiraceae bacterium]|nr:geranylgeranyl diphosphate reductase [Nitrospiraceae bacterium]